ncbi:DUF7927 domain-containing protein [Agromyces ramosus]|uniref:Gram-positive cocci surface proteins LPxTG domain-containing protein n=1 Tax=Agromyces ramosus TaxID=33879 RepID=A0ABU0RBB0_9MICO|nr:hypothetical protein [Agromyces ramosus]MDQ0895356.1 hypothetical protein [Agromyces ramosus]
MHRYSPAHHAIRSERLRPRAGVTATVAGFVVGALVLFGAPTVAAADELAAAPADTTVVAPAEVATTDPEAPPPAEPVAEPVVEPVVEPVAEPAVAEPSGDPPAGPPVDPVVSEASSPEPAPEPVTAAARLALDTADGNGGPPVTTIPAWKDKVAICHATSSESNPYVSISPSVRSIIDPNGDPEDPTDPSHAHSEHQDFGDIIPAFDYFDKEGVEHHFPGLNLHLLPIFENDCDLPEPALQLSVVPCPPAGAVTRLLHVTVSGVVISFDYELTVYVSGTDDVVAELTFEAATGTFDGDFEPLPPGAYDVTLHRVGADPDEDRTVTIVLEACPPPLVPGWELIKSSDPTDGETVEAGDVITYYLDAENTSEATVTGAQAFDNVADVLDNATLLELGPGLTGPVGNVLTWTLPTLEPGEAVQTWYTVEVGEDVVGELLHNVVEPSEGGECPPGGEDANGPCVVDHPVKSIALDGQAICKNDTPLFSYAITPFNIDDPAANPIVLIWWTPEAFAARDPSLPAGDIAAILADGASQVDPIAYPAGWSSGVTISDEQLWPGAAVDAQGNPTDWPGWTLLPDGTWILDPSAPFYDLRAEAVVEIRINPSTDAIAVYPPPTPNCNAAPPPNQAKPASTPTTPTGLASTGVETSGLLPFAAALLLLGAAGLGVAARRRSMG